MIQRSRKREATDEQRGFATDFARWQQEARERKGWAMTDLAAHIPFSYSLVRIFDAASYGGIDDEKRYREPPLDYIAAVAKATGADYWAGVKASRGPAALLAATTDSRLEVMFTWHGRPATLNVPEGMPPDVLDRLRRMSEAFIEGQDSVSEHGTEPDAANVGEPGAGGGKQNKTVRRRNN